MVGSHQQSAVSFQLAEPDVTVLKLLILFLLALKADHCLLITC